MADQGGNNNIVMRDYRKGNWTISETMVLIEAKKMDDERRMMMKRSNSAVVVGGGGGDHNSEARPSSSKPAELRWKWVEDYCWRKGCLRSQNQCNDKWDNLMRDFKKVREYERRIAERRGGDQGSNNEVVSYWNMEKNERKEKNLPSNMMPQIYESLVEVVERKAASHQRMVSGGSAPTTPTTPTTMGGYVVERPLMSSVQASLAPLLPHQVSTVPIPVALSLPPPPQHEAHPQPPPSALPCLPTVDSDTSEYSDSPAKRRRRGGGGGGGGRNGSGGEGTSHGTGANATASTSSSHEVGSAISKSASIIAEALQACEEREERRHRDLISLHERRLKIEESKTDISRQGINGLVDAINKLASSLLALASHKNQASAPK